MAIKTADIEKALGSLKKEVEDLHPHLKGFLEKLKDVNHVEYTHGPNEQGADFILTNKNNLTGQTDYIGVIAKNTGITQSSIEEVNRQISECTKVKRHIKNGKHHIRLDEVWVICNGTISKNSKEKIHEIHKTGIKFFDRKELASLMEKNAYTFSEYLPTDISICLSKQLGLAATLRSRSVGLETLDAGDIFMEQSVTKLEPIQYTYRKHAPKKRTLQKIPIQSAIRDSHTFILYGKPGCGKSKMLQNVLSKYANIEEYKKTKIIPIYVTCKDMLEKYEKKINSLTYCFEKEHNLLNVKSDFFYMIIIDGIDECGLFREQRLEIIKEWKKESSPGKVKRMIFASRDYIEEKTLNVPTYRIDDLSINEIIKTIKKHLADLDTVDQIVDDIVHSNIFRSLLQSPLATIILINLLKDESGRHELPANLTDLFAKYTECSLGRWDTTTQEGMRQKRYEAANKILTEIAVYMLDQDIDQINEKEARGIFREYLIKRNLGIEPDHLFDSVTNRSNLLYLNDGVFRFRHRTIMEFFYSKKFSDAKIKEIGENIFDIQWAHVLFFYVGLKKDCPELLEKINAVEPQDESGKILKAINMGNILLAGYATPYLHVQKILQSIFIGISQHLDDVFSKRITDSGLNKLSIMRTLLFFRFVMDYEYSRPFFKRAIEDSLIRIEDLNLDSNVKALSLFLLNLAHASLGGENIFAGMIDKLGNEIPAYLKLAINHETDFMERVGRDVKKFKRTIKRGLLSAKRKDSVNYLYTKEIRYLPSPKNENQ